MKTAKNEGKKKKAKKLKKKTNKNKLIHIEKAS